MSASQELLDTTITPDVTVSTSSEEVLLISQPQATEPTTIRVAVTQTLIDVDGRTVRSVRNDTYEITTTAYQLLTDVQNYQTLVGQPGATTTVNVQRRLTAEVPGPVQTITGGTIQDVSTYDFEGSKFGGTISASSGKQQGWGDPRFPTISRYDFATNKWSVVLDVPEYTARTYTYAAVGLDPGTPRPKFRASNPGPSGNKDDYYINTLVYPTSSTQENQLVAGTADIVQPDTTGYQAAQQVIYKVVPNPDGTITTSETRPVSGPESQELRYTPGTPTSLFNPRASALLTAQGVFRLPENLNSPAIDLFSYIQADINS